MSIRNDLDQILGKYQIHYPSMIFHSKEAYGEWLAQTYYFVRHSTSLLGYAMPHLHNDDLRRHFEQHLAEEKRHDLLLLKDLERLGMKIENFEEFNLTQAFYQSQYYRISFQDGTSLLGYILFLEGLAVSWGKNLHADLSKKHKNSVLFLKVHAEEDPHHVEAAVNTIMKLSEKEQKLIVQNMLYSHEIYESIIQKILLSKTGKKAA